MDGGILSQDEINALLNGMDLSGETDAFQSAGGDDDNQLLTEAERDAVGEVANISMGSSATTLYSLVNRKVSITTPVVSVTDWESLMDPREQQCVFIQIKYTAGLEGSNILVLNERDVKVITDLMMGGDGTNTDGELGELHLSAISEAMNQMMGSAATSLSTMLKVIIDISPPSSSLLDLTKQVKGQDIAPFLGGKFVKVAFKMQIGDLVDSTIMQLYPVELAKNLVETFLNTQMEELANFKPADEEKTTDTPVSAGMSEMNHLSNGSGNMEQTGFGEVNQMGMNDMGMNQMGMNGMGMNGMGMNQMGMNGMGMNGMGMNPMGMNQDALQNVSVSPARFQSFTNDVGAMTGHENIDLIMDVPLEVTVELGRTSRSISEILSFAPGTIIELDRIAGEPIDVLVNGKYVAKGEVVVIEESFGIRVTEIIK